MVELLARMNSAACNRNSLADSYRRSPLLIECIGLIDGII